MHCLIKRDSSGNIDRVFNPIEIQRTGKDIEKSFPLLQAFKNKTFAKNVFLGRGKTPLDLRKLRGYMREAANVEVFTVYDMALQYFVGGGRISTAGIRSLLKGRGEMNSRISYWRTDGSTIDQIAHYLYENQEPYGRFDTEQFRDAVEDVVLSFNSPFAMAKELLERTTEKQQEVPFDFLEEELNAAFHLLDTLSPRELSEYEAGRGIVDVQLPAQEDKETTALVTRYLQENLGIDVNIMSKDQINSELHKLGYGTLENPNLSFLVSGEKALDVNQRKLNLQIAKEMELKGVPPINIKLATGWEYNTKQKLWQEELADPIVKNNIEVEFNSEHPYFKTPVSKLKLSDLVDLSYLKEYYPELENVPVIVFNTDNYLDDNLLFTDGTSLFINFKEYGKTKNTLDFSAREGDLYHEIQHLIQNIEGFERGTTPTEVGQLIIDYVNYLREGDTKNDDRTEEQRRFEPLFTEFLNREQPKAIVAIKQKELPPEFFAAAHKNKFYRYTVGEIEASNVVSRAAKDSEFRRNTLLEQTEIVDRDIQISMDSILGVKFLSKDDIVYGFYNPATNQIFLTEEYLNSSTLMHELWHLVIPSIRSAASSGDVQAQNILSTMKNLVDETFNEQLYIDRFSGVSETTTERMSSEAYSPREGETQNSYIQRMREEYEANLIGDNATQYFSQIAKENNLNEQETQSLFAKIQNFIKSVASWLSNKLGFNISPEEAVKLPVKEVLDRITTTILKGEFLPTTPTNVDFEMFEAKRQSQSIQLEYDSEGRHLAPNGKPSKLTEAQAKLVRTPAFISWFGDFINNPEESSKVLDENGEPLVLYRGTSTTMIPEYSGRQFFTPNKAYAQRFTRGVGEINEFFLNIKSPVELEKFNSIAAKNNITGTQVGEGIFQISAYEIDKESPWMVPLKLLEKAGEKTAVKEFKDALKTRDGFIGYDAGFYGEVMAYVIEENNQAKLADGTNTTFSSNVADVRMSSEQPPKFNDKYQQPTLYFQVLSKYRDNKHFKYSNLIYPDVVFKDIKTKEQVKVAVNFYTKLINNFNKKFNRNLKLIINESPSDFSIIVEYETGLQPKYFAYPTATIGEHVVVDTITKDVPLTSLRHELIHEILVKNITDKFERINQLDQSAAAATLEEVQRGRAYNYTLEDVFFERVVENVERLPDMKDTFPIEIFMVDVINRLESEIESFEKEEVLNKLKQLLQGSNQWLTSTLVDIFSKNDINFNNLGNEAEFLGKKFKQKFDLAKNIFTDELQSNLFDFTEFFNQEYSGVLTRLKKIDKRADIVRSDVPAGNRLFSAPLEDALTIAKEYHTENNIPFTDPIKITKENFNKSRAKEIAKLYDEAVNSPTNTEVKEGYEAMIKETIEQYKKIVSKGYKVEINNSEPYGSSSEMIEDLRSNRRMKIFSTEHGFGDSLITEKQRQENPLLRDSGFKDINGKTLLANDIFRFVHDFFGHSLLGNSFGYLGEENAWNIHAEMYSPKARRAMTSETRGQNSYVNFSGVNDEAFALRDQARQLRNEGRFKEAEELSSKVYDMMKFAEQKITLLPEWVSDNSVYKEAQSTNTITTAIQRNNGNPLNLAPNGKPSILYQSYKDLGYTDVEAESLVAQTYTDEFGEWFGKWWETDNNNNKNTYNGQERKSIEEGNDFLQDFTNELRVYEGEYSSEDVFNQLRTKYPEAVLDGIDERLGEEAGNGTEAIVWANPDNKSVIKAISYDMEGSIGNLIDKIVVHNTIFPETRIKVIGVSKLSDGTNTLVVEQPFVDYDNSRTMSREEIVAFMETKGFTTTSTEEFPEFSNGRYTIADLHEGNIGFTKGGNIAVIDFFADIKRENEVSKVVDENGQPLLTGRVDSIRTTNYGDNQIFFADAKDVTSFKGEFGQYLNYMFLNIKNPFMVTQAWEWSDVPIFEIFPVQQAIDVINFSQGFTGDALLTLDNYEEVLSEQGIPVSTDELSNYVKNFLNNDGVIFKDIYEGTAKTIKTNDYVTFNTNQIKSATENIGAFSPTNPDIRFSVIGEQGASRVEKYNTSLNKAKELEKQGVDISEIEQQTGWYKVNNQWKYLAPELIEQFKIKPDYETNRLYPIQDILQNKDTLLQMYPEISDVKVVFYDNTSKNPLLETKNWSKSAGAFQTEKNILGVNTLHMGSRREARQIEKTLAHELTHSIARVEGFPLGGNQNSLITEAFKLLNTPPIITFKQAYGFLKTADKKGMTKAQKNIIDGALETLTASMRGDFVTLNRQYRQLAGEVDARLVEDVYEKLEKGEKITLPYSQYLQLFAKEDGVDLNNLYFLSNGEVQFSLFSEIDNKTPVQITQELIDKLKQNGLSEDVFLMSTQEIDAKLKELGVSDDVRKQVADYIKGYYSNANVAFSNLKDKNVKNVQGWMKALTDVQKNGGIKNVNQELEWIGLEDFLNEYVRENNPKNGNIPASVVEEYILSNQIEIIDFSKGGKTLSSDVFDIKFEEGEFIVTRNGEYEISFDNEDIANDYIAMTEIRDESDQVKYSGYQLKGGENYREVLLTMPDKKKKVFGELSETLDYARDTYGINSAEYRSVKKSLVNTLEEKYGLDDDAIQDLFVMYEESPDAYKSSHWDESNVLAHVRLNEKTLLDGRRVLILNEIQSDWAQQGRKEGFIDKELQRKSDIASTKYKSLQEELAAIKESKKANKDAYQKILYNDGKGYTTNIDEYGNVTIAKAVNDFGKQLGDSTGVEAVKEEEGNYRIYVDGQVLGTSNYYGSKEVAERTIEERKNRIDFIKSFENTVEIENLPSVEQEGFRVIQDYYSKVVPLERQISAVKRDIIQQSGVQPMPYTNTDQWVGLVIRRVIQMASQEGFDGIAFATGQQSADMYSLAQQVDKITITPNNEKDKINRLRNEAQKKGNFELVDYYDEQLSKSEDIKVVYISMKNNADDTIFINQEGIITESASGVYNGKQAEEVLGKDLTRKILETEEDTTLKGEGLEFGGEGMKTFYDKIVPKVVQKESQRFDKNSKIETVDFGEKTNVHITEEDGGFILRVDNKFVEYVDEETLLNTNLEATKEGAKKYFEKYIPQEINADRLSLGVQPYLPLTKNIKDSVSQGVPQFQKTLNNVGINLITNGFVYNNQVFLNKDTATDETAIHEFSHLFNSWLKENRKELYEKGIDLVKKEVGLRNVNYELRRPSENKLIFVDPSKLLERLDKDEPSYSVLNKNNQIGNRVEKAKEYLNKYLADQRAINPRTGERTKTTLSFEPSLVSIYNNKLGFTDGRHRVLAAKELGLREVGIEIPIEQEELFKDLLSQPSEIQDIISYVRTTQPDLKGEAFYEEVLAEITGKRGAELLNSKKKSGIIDWIREAFKEIGKMLGLLEATPEQISKMTLKDFADASAVQMMKGEVIRKSPIVAEKSLEEVGLLETSNLYSPEFMSWFSGSIAVDVNNNPLLFIKNSEGQYEQFSGQTDVIPVALSVQVSDIKIINPFTGLNLKDVRNMKENATLDITPTQSITKISEEMYEVMENNKSVFIGNFTEISPIIKIGKVEVTNESLVREIATTPMSENNFSLVGAKLSALVANEVVEKVDCQ